MSLLPAEFQAERVSFSGVEEIDLHPIRLRHAEPHFFRIDADIVVTDREAGAEDGGVHAMQGSAAEFVLLRERGERRGGRVGRNAKDDVVVGIDVLFEAHGGAFGRHCLVGEVKVAAAGDFVGEDSAALESELLHDAGMKRLVEKVHRVRLDREFGVFKKLEILHPRGIGQVDENADALALAGGKGALEKGGEVEGRKDAARGLLLNSR